MASSENHLEYNPDFPPPHTSGNVAVVTHHGDGKTGLTQSVYGHETSKSICLLVGHFDSCNTEEFLKAGIELDKDLNILLLKKTFV